MPSPAQTTVIDKPESRYAIANRLTAYLTKNFACDKNTTVNNAADKNSVQQIMLDGIWVMYTTVTYSTRDTHNKKIKNVVSQSFIEDITAWINYTIESNYTGFNYFPYIYGVISCKLQHYNIMYLYYELFNGTLDDNFSVSHQNIWYDVIFQILTIADYLETTAAYSFNSSLLNYLQYNKLPQPYTGKYTIDGADVAVKHHYLITFWSLDLCSKSNQSLIVATCNDLIQKFPALKNNSKLYSLLKRLVETPQLFKNLMSTIYAAKK